MFDRIWPEDLKPARKFFAEMLKNPGKRIAFQIRVNGKNNKPQWIDGTGVNWLAKPGLQALVLHYRDVTEAKEAAAALEESERRYRSLFENARLAAFQSTLEGKVIRVNNEFARMFGYRSPEDVMQTVRDVGKDIFADPARRLEIIRLREKDPRLTTFDNLYQRKDGSTFWGRLTVRSETDAKGKVLHFEGFIEDITKNRAMEESLRESEEKFRSMFQSSAAGAALVGLDGRYLMVNPVLCEILGYTDKELLSTNFFKLTHPGDVEISRKAMLGVLEGKEKNVRFDKRYLHKDGHTIWTEVSSALVCDASGKPLHFVAQVIDITKRRQAEEALRQSEAHYRTLVEASPVAVTITDLNGTILMCNGQTAALLGHARPEDLVGSTAFKFFAPEEAERAGANLQRTMKDGIVRNIEYCLVKKDGSRFPGELTAALITDAGGKPAAFMAVVQDISERKRAEEALRDSEERYRQLVEQAAEGIVELDPQGKFVFVNSKVCDMLGYTREEMLRMNVLDTYPEELREEGRARTDLIRAGQIQRFERPMRRKDGSLIAIEGTGIRLASGNLQEIMHDITKRRRAEEELRRSEERYRRLYDNSLEGIGLSRGNQILDANKALLEIFGYANAEEMRAVPLIELVAPESGS